MKALDGFFDGDEPVDVAPEPVVVEAPPPVDAEPVAVDPPVDEPQQIPDDVKGLRDALVATRRDWKDKATRAETERDMLRQQLDELKRAPVVAAPVAAPVAPIAPAPRPNQFEDPEGYETWLRAQIRGEAREEAAREAVSDRLNRSEARLRKEAPADLDAAIDAFKEAANNSPKLRAGLALEDDPFRWAYEQGKLARQMADPVAMRAAIAAEERAKVVAEYAGVAPAASSVVLPRSLTGVASAAARTVEESGDLDFDAIFDRRKKRT